MPWEINWPDNQRIDRVSGGRTRTHRTAPPPRLVGSTLPLPTESRMDVGDGGETLFSNWVPPRQIVVVWRARLQVQAHSHMSQFYQML